MQINLSGFIFQWLNAWAFGFVAALPTIFLVAPLVRKLVKSIVVMQNKQGSLLYYDH